MKAWKGVGGIAPSFLNFGTRRKVSGQFHAPFTVPTGVNTLIRIAQEARRAAEPVCISGKEKNFSPHTGRRTPTLLSSNSQPRHILTELTRPHSHKSTNWNSKGYTFQHNKAPYSKVFICTFWFMIYLTVSLDRSVTIVKTLWAGLTENLGFDPRCVQYFYPLHSIQTHSDAQQSPPL